MSGVSQILERVQKGDPKAAEELLPLVYEDLRNLAAHKLAGEAASHTLQPTTLVHEAWLRLVGAPEQQWNHRGHFFAAAAEARRRILVENARRKQRVKHGNGQQRFDLDTLEALALYGARRARKNWLCFVFIGTARSKPPDGSALV